MRFRYEWLKLSQYRKISFRTQGKFFFVSLNTTLKALTTKKILTEKEEKKRKGREIRTEVQ